MLRRATTMEGAGLTPFKGEALAAGAAASGPYMHRRAPAGRCSNVIAEIDERDIRGRALFVGAGRDTLGRTASSRAAMFDAVAHPIAVGLRSHVPKWTPTQTRCFSGGRPVCARPCRSTSMAQRTASTTLRNSMIEPSPVCLTMRRGAIAGSMRSLRGRGQGPLFVGACEPAVATTWTPKSPRASGCHSSAPLRRRKPTQIELSSLFGQFDVRVRHSRATGGRFPRVPLRDKILANHQVAPFRASSV